MHSGNSHREILGRQNSPTSPACTCPNYFILTVVTSCFVFAVKYAHATSLHSFLGRTSQTRKPEC
jgi:hypothetical protein